MKHSQHVLKSTLKTELKNEDNVNPKIDILLEVFSDIKILCDKMKEKGDIYVSSLHINRQI